RRGSIGGSGGEECSARAVVPLGPPAPRRGGTGTRAAPVRSPGAHLPPLPHSPTPQIPAPQGWRAVAAAAAVRRPGRAAVGARRPLRDPGRGRLVASGREDAPVRRPQPARASRALRSRTAHPRPVPREHPESREPCAEPRTGRGSRAAQEPVRGGRRDRGTRPGRRAAVPARRRAGRRQDDLRCSRRDRGGRRPRRAASARGRRPAGGDHDRALVPHHHRARRRRPGMGGDHLGPPGEGRGARVGREHRGRGPRAATDHHEAVEAVGADLGHARPHEKAPFVIATTATPGHTPLELPYLAPAYAQVHGEPMSEWTSVKEPGTDFAAALERHGIALERGRYGATWTTDATRRAEDLARVRGWLEDAQPTAMLQRAAPWGPVPISGMPVTLTPAELDAYEAEWGEFCREMDIARRGRNTAKGRAALLRFRQKAVLIRVDSTVAWIAQ